MDIPKPPALKSLLSRVLLIVLLILAATLRLYKLDQIPPGVNRDEASIGYTAYSLLKTGKDEYGRLFPLSFQSFGDWKLPLYIYTTVPFVGSLGLSEIAVRLPSALAGIATVALTYLLVLELFSNSTLALLAMGVISVSPWHIHLSRVESESNIAVFLVTLGTILLLRGLKKTKQAFHVPLGFLLLALSYWAYHGNHIFTTLFVATIGWLYRKEAYKRKDVWVGFSFFLLLSGYIFTLTLTGADKTKISGIGIFGDPTVVHQRIEMPRNEHANPNSLAAKLIHNRVIYTVDTVMKNYLQSFSPDFLFFVGGGNHAHNIANVGNMYPIDAPFLLLGVAALLGALRTREALLILIWLAISPLASSITKDAPHTNRMFAIFPALPIAVAYGIHWLITKLSRYKKILPLTIVLIVILYVASIAQYLEQYYIHFPRNETQYWGASYKKLSGLLSQPALTNKHVIISHPEYSPYIFLLFYSGYDPRAYQREAVRYPLTNDAFVHVQSFGRFGFRAIDWTRDLAATGTILIDDPRDIPGAIYSGRGHIADVTLPNGTVQFAVVETER